MCESNGFWGELASRLAKPFGHPSQVRMQVLVLQTCVDLRVRLARALRFLSHFPRSCNTRLVSFMKTSDYKGIVYVHLDG